MRLPIRKTFAAVLWGTALVPASLVVGFQLAPAVLYDAVDSGQLWLLRALWFVLGATLLALVAYPPFLPLVRLRVGEWRRRLSTDRTPYYDKLVRLRHLETHDDRLAVGKMAWQMDELAEALEHLTRAHELEPDHLGGRYQLGALLAELSRPSEAIELLRGVVDADEKHAFGDALFYLGRSLYRSQEAAEALTRLQRHQELFPGNREVHLLVARVLAALGRMEEARAELGKARRPAEPSEPFLPREALARARARVTILRKGRHDG